MLEKTLQRETKSTMNTLPIEKILPDKNQPREYFAADKLFQVRESIKNHGIITPLNVMDNGDGTYLLVDGERRYRAAMELGLREVPVVIEPPMSDEDRLIRQFQIQEYHEPWTPIEKAQSIITLSNTLGMTLPEVCKLLGISPRDSRRYITFAALADKAAYVASETPLAYTESISALKAVARRVSETELDEDFTINDEKAIETRVISMVKSGAVKNRAQLTKIGDAIRKDPQTLKKLISLEEEVTSPEQLFREAKAKGAHALRNLHYQCRYIIQHGNIFLQERDVKITPEQFDVLIRARDVLSKVIDIA